MTIGRRSRSRSRTNGSNWGLLVGVGVVAVLLISGLVIAPSAAFTTGSVDRGSTAPLAADSEGFLGIDDTDSLQAGSEEDRLVTVTNNLNQPLTVSVSSSSATLSNSQATLNPGDSLTTAATVGCESPPSQLDFTITASTGGEFSGVATRSATVDDSGCTGSTLGFGSLGITDGSTSEKGGKAEYTLTYSVEGDTGSFERVSVDFKNVNRNDTTTDSSSAQSGTIAFESGGNRFGDSYEITVRLIDDTGEVRSERIINDTADGD